MEKEMIKILLLNGPNLNMLGVRDTDMYGKKTLPEIEDEVCQHALNLGVNVVCKQSNCEGDIIDIIQQSTELYDGIIYNPGAHAHYSYAIRDAIDAVDTPVVEVHITDIFSREEFRHVDVVEPVCIASIVGHGTDGYVEAFDVLCERLTRLG